ncbi:hypothetical protein EVAR_101938_1 [Eumeta japonica]|uniref:Uncharacterized protein n=1 Tax=Eumeta variegata TaxID=151549 RepID=A0A4C1TSN2_EUMVA|nr:hypothetical protein EVAR_101938_1 [Eumeta japonica]
MHIFRSTVEIGIKTDIVQEGRTGIIIETAIGSYANPTKHPARFRANLIGVRCIDSGAFFHTGAEEIHPQHPPDFASNTARPPPDRCLRRDPPSGPKCIINGGRNALGRRFYASPKCPKSLLIESNAEAAATESNLEIHRSTRQYPTANSRHGVTSDIRRY